MFKLVYIKKSSINFHRILKVENTISIYTQLINLIHKNQKIIRKRSLAKQQTSKIYNFPYLS